MPDAEAPSLAVLDRPEFSVEPETQPAQAREAVDALCGGLMPPDAASAARFERSIRVSDQCAGLKRALDRLEPESRELLVLRFIEELSYAEMVDVVGSTESAVRGKVFLALHKLRARWDEQEVSDAM